jgi:hypothetical protein
VWVFISHFVFYHRVIDVVSVVFCGTLVAPHLFFSNQHKHTKQSEAIARVVLCDGIDVTVSSAMNNVSRHHLYDASDVDHHYAFEDFAHDEAQFGGSGDENLMYDHDSVDNDDVVLVFDDDTAQRKRHRPAMRIAHPPRNSAVAAADRVQRKLGI